MSTLYTTTSTILLFGAIIISLKKPTPEVKITLHPLTTTSSMFCRSTSKLPNSYFGDQLLRAAPPFNPTFSADIG